MGLAILGRDRRQDIGRLQHPHGVVIEETARIAEELRASAGVGLNALDPAQDLPDQEIVGPPARAAPIIPVSQGRP